MTEQSFKSGATLSVLTPGLMTTLQDHGRFGLRSLGVPWSGAMTPVWQQLANALVGNDERHCIIECFEGGLTLKSGDQAVRIAVMAASDAMMHLETGNESKPLTAARSYTLAPDTVFKLKSTGSFRHAVIAIQGLCVKDHLGSASTYSKASLGGIDGKALTGGDQLLTSAIPQGLDRECVDPLAKAYSTPVLRIVLGPQDDHFSASAIETLLSSEYTLSTEVDRMGARLTGLPLQHRDAAARDIVSDAILPGSIQIPGNGQPIVLLNDAHTAGGYPKIATVVSIDLPLLGLQRSGTRFRFEALSVEDAIAAVRHQVLDVKKAIKQIATLKDFTLTTEILLAHNLISGVTDGNIL